MIEPGHLKFEFCQAHPSSSSAEMSEALILFSPDPIKLMKERNKSRLAIPQEKNIQQERRESWRITDG